MPAVMTVRVACISATWCSSDRTPRTLVAITEPIATMETATIASAISTSMIVKPASPRSVGGGVAGNNLDPPGQPVNTDFKTSIEARQPDGPPARRSVCKKTDSRQRCLLPAGLRQYGVEAHIVGDVD